jgi:HEPN domain-containing protein
MKRKDFQDLAALRLKEARVLLGAGCFEGAYYIAGYAVECALKACISKQTRRHEFPDKKRAERAYDHDLVKLLGLADLETKLKETERIDPELNGNWDIVRDWWEQSRYERPSQVEAENLIRAIGDRQHGFLQWLRRFW